MAEWTPLNSKPLRKGEWDKLSSGAKPTPADLARDKSARREDIQKDQLWLAQKLDADEAFRVAEAAQFNHDWVNMKLNMADLQQRLPLQLNDLQGDVASLQAEADMLRDVIAASQASEGTPMDIQGGDMLPASGNVVTWDYKKESFGWKKVNADRLWVYNGYVRDIDTYHFVDSLAVTLTDTTAYAYVAQNRTTNATSIAVIASEPDDTTDSYRWPIARFVKTDVTGAGDYTWEPRKVYHTGDVTVPYIDIADVPDANSTNDVSGEKRYYSMEKSTRTGHVDEWQDYDWDDASTYQPNDSDFIVMRASLGSGADRYYIKKYATMNDAVSNVDWSYEYGDDNSIVGDIITTINTYAGGGNYWIRGGDNDSCYGSAIGNSAKNEVIDLDGETITNAGGNISTNWGARTLNDDAAAKEVLNWNAAGWKLDFATDDIWNASGLKIGSIIDAGASTASFVLAGGAKIAKTIRGDAAIAATTGGAAIYAPNGGVTALGIYLNGATPTIEGDNALSLDAKNGDLTLGTSSLIVYGSVDGTASIPNWINLGGFVATDAAKYRIRAIDADTGAEVDIEVLGRSI